MARFDHRAFLRLVDMTPAEIRRWHADPRSACASEPATRTRLVRSHRYLGPGRPPAKKSLPSLEKLVAQIRRGKTLSEEERLYAEAVANFVKRHKAQGCSPRRAAALANWGSRACKVPAKVPGCAGLGRPPKVICPGREAVIVQMHTRCAPPKRKPQPEPAPEPAPAVSGLRRRSAAKAPRRARETKEDRAAREAYELEQSRRALRSLVGSLRHAPTERDIDPRSFPANPCTGTRYEAWRGSYNRGHASYLKPHAWQSEIAGCVREEWCAKKGPCDDDAGEVDSRDFMDGLRKKKRTKPKKTARKRSR